MAPRIAATMELLKARVVPAGNRRCLYSMSELAIMGIQLVIRLEIRHLRETLVVRDGQPGLRGQQGLRALFAGRFDNMDNIEKVRGLTYRTPKFA